MKIINISGGLSPSCVIMVPFYCQLLEWLKIHWVSSVLYLSQIVWEKKFVKKGKQRKEIRTHHMIIFTKQAKYFSISVINNLLDNAGAMFIEMGTTIGLFMCGFLLKVHKNYFSNYVLTARIHGLGCGIYPVPVTYLLVIHHLRLLGTCHHFSLH